VQSEEINMSMQNFSTSFMVERSPEEVFAAINNVRNWWSGRVEGNADRLGEEFSYRYEDVHYSKQKVTELVPGKRIAWHVIDGHLSFIEDKQEWKGTDIVFDIVPKGNGTELRFTHVGLTPSGECYGACSSGWTAIINGNLREFITTGKAPADPFAAEA